MSMGYNSKMRISNKFIGRMRFAFSKSSVFKASILLNRSDRLKLSSMAVFQVILGFLDIAGVLFLGALGALSVQGIEARPPGNKVSVFLKILGIKHLTFQHQVAFLGTTSAILLISKTLISAYYSRKTLFFLTRKSSEISGIIISKILSQDIVQLQRLTSQETLYIVTNGVNGLLIGILGSVITIIADSIMLIILTMALFFTDPILAISTSGIFLVTGFLLYYFLQVRASEIGKLYQELTIANNQKLLEVLESYRETIVRDRRSFYVKEIQSLRRQLSTVFAELSFQPYISKYVIELTSIISALLLAAYEFDTKDAVHAVAVLVVFLAASSRIAPSVLRIQQGFLAIKSNEGSSEITFRLLSEIEKVKVEDSHFNEPLFEYPDFVPNVSLREINFAYDNSESFRLSGINLDISAGSTVAIVGPSGSGKSTLVDLILGVLNPDTGDVEISGVPPRQVSRSWPGAIAYVPQNVAISSGTVLENVGLSYSLNTITRERVAIALKAAQFYDEVKQFSHGINSNVGERGSKLSGGQRQRLGIARALFTQPKLLVLDESTSALDGATEAQITKTISTFSGKVTTIIVAHRLSTVQNADLVVYLENGKILATGTFSDVRKKVPNFDIQAKLMGL